MKKSIKTILAGLLVMPVLAFGVTVFNPAPQSAGAYAAGDTILTGATNTKGVAQNTNLFGTDGIITSIINMALYALGGISVLMLVYGGIRYTVSGGNEKGVTGAKNTILYAIVGLVVCLLA